MIDSALLRKNLWLKLGALVLAVSLWFYVAGEESIEVSLKVPVHLVLAPGMIIAEQKVDTLSVFLRGRKEAITKLNMDKLVSKIDLTLYKEPKTIVFSVDKKSLDLGPDVDVLQMVPERVEVKIDRLLQKVMPVKVVTEGEPAPGYEVSGFIIDPIAVLIKGPESLLKDLVYVNTEQLDVTGRQKSFKKMAPLKSVTLGAEKAPPQFIEVVVEITESQKKQKNK